MNGRQLMFMMMMMMVVAQTLINFRNLQQTDQMAHQTTTAHRSRTSTAAIRGPLLKRSLALAIHSARSSTIRTTSLTTTTIYSRRRWVALMTTFSRRPSAWDAHRTVSVVLFGELPSVLASAGEY